MLARIAGLVYFDELCFVTTRNEEVREVNLVVRQIFSCREDSCILNMTFYE